MDSSVFSVDSRKPVQKVGEDLLAACARNKFGVLGTIDLKAKMKEKGVEYAGDCLIFEICNPQQAKKALDADPQISAALPCRVSVFGTPGGTRLSTIRPTVMLALFGAKGIESVAKEVETTITAIMNEAAR